MSEKKIVACGVEIVQVHREDCPNHPDHPVHRHVTESVGARTGAVTDDYRKGWETIFGRSQKPGSA